MNQATSVTTVTTVTTVTSREFNQDSSRVRRAARTGPVFITDRGKPSQVLLSIEEYRRLTGQRQSIADLLAMPDAAAAELKIPRRADRGRPADLS